MKCCFLPATGLCLALRACNQEKTPEVNDGLAVNQILSACRFRDRVYVTTLSGVFYKSYDDFLTFKPEK